MKKSWYGIKTFFLSKIDGSPKNKDGLYKKSTVMLEERIVIFYAKDLKAAVQMGIKEAKQYSRYKYINPYGEKVKMEFLNMWDTFELFDDPSSGVEVFSINDIYMNKKSALDAAKIKLGSNFKENLERGLRNRFQHM